MNKTKMKNGRWFFYEDRLVTEDVDECRKGTHQCNTKANCSNTPGSYNCQCQIGYEGNGKKCNGQLKAIFIINHSDHQSILKKYVRYSNKKRNKSSPKNLSMADSDVDECEKGTHKCDKNAKCTNTPGSFNCQCLSNLVTQEKDGYAKMSTNVKKERTNVTKMQNASTLQVHSTASVNLVTQEKDENAKVLSDYFYDNYLATLTKPLLVSFSTLDRDPCGYNANCTNTNGSYICECRTGYEGNGTNCTDIDECEKGTHKCDKNAKCTNTPGSFNCQCQPGHTGEGRICEDVDECEKRSHKCDKNAKCTNTRGSFNCQCQPGYTGEGRICEDVDECEKRSHKCDKNAKCTNTPGSFNCQCQPGYIGEGRICEDVDECEKDRTNVTKMQNAPTLQAHSTMSTNVKKERTNVTKMQNASTLQVHSTASVNLVTQEKDENAK
ncbi:fibrillin-2-like, partial [Dendronephthya gigantea]|uniref:fibrillin-2-like n=1 Tax=Dendronephthya gigantea TaxID=151771 RepID=UPI00106C6BA7